MRINASSSHDYQNLIDKIVKQCMVTMKLLDLTQISPDEPVKFARTMPTAKVSLPTNTNSSTPNTLPNSNYNTALDLTVNADQQNQLITPINDNR